MPDQAQITAWLTDTDRVDYARMDGRDRARARIYLLRGALTDRADQVNQRGMTRAWKRAMGYYGISHAITRSLVHSGFNMMKNQGLYISDRAVLGAIRDAFGPLTSAELDRPLSGLADTQIETDPCRLRLLLRHALEYIERLEARTHITNRVVVDAIKEAVGHGEG